MIKVGLIRGSYLNNFEGQNYQFNKKKIKLTAISSFYSLDNKFSFPVIRLFSIADLQQIYFLHKPIKFISNRILGDSQILFGLENYAKKFDIFHSADPHYYYSYQLAKLRAKKMIKKLIITSWETIPFNNEKTTAKRKIKYFALSNADLFLCYTQKAKQSLVKENVDESKIRVVRLGVDLKKFKPGRKKQNQTLKILFVGRLVKEKGVMDLLRAFINLKSEGFKNLKLDFIGKGDLKNEMEKKIKSVGLTNEIRIINKTYQDMPSVYQKADIFVLPSKKTNTWEEQYGMVLVEAMASGLPIIASKSGAIPKILGNIGLYFQEGNINELTRALKFLINNPSLQLELGKMGRERVEKLFDCQKTAREIEKIYLHLINK